MGTEVQQYGGSEASYFQDLAITSGVTAHNPNEARKRLLAFAASRHAASRTLKDEREKDRARQKLGRHEPEIRAVADGDAFYPTEPPAFIADEFETAARAAGVLPSILIPRPLPPTGNDITIPTFATGATAYPQDGEGEAITTSELTTATSTSSVRTIMATVELSRQLFERTRDAGFDLALAQELGEALALELDRQILAGSGDDGELLGLLEADNTTATSYADATPTQAEAWTKLLANYAATATAAGRSPTDLLLSPGRRAWFANWQGASGEDVEPLPANLEYLPTVHEVPAMPITLGAGTEDAAVHLRPSAAYLSTTSPKFEITASGIETVTARTFLYSALAVKRSAAIGIVSGTGFAAPVFS